MIMNGSPSPSISVVIPTLSRDACLFSMLEDLARQDYPVWDCIVVLQGESGNVHAERIRRVLGKRVRVFYLEAANASMARNIGLLESTADVVLFLDDDVIIRSPGFLAAHASNYADPSCGGVAGRILADDQAFDEEPTRARTTRLFYGFRRDSTVRSRVRHGGAGNLSVRREWAVNAGGMDAQFEKGAFREESDFCLRFTRRFGPLVFDPEAWLVHIGEKQGGCRSWGPSRGMYPMHHVVGEWYFILKGLRIGTLSFMDAAGHLSFLFRRQLFNRPNCSSPLRFAEALAWMIRGGFLASANIRFGPKELAWLGKTMYRKL